MFDFDRALFKLLKHLLDGSILYMAFKIDEKHIGPDAVWCGPSLDFSQTHLIGIEGL